MTSLASTPEAEVPLALESGDDAIVAPRDQAWTAKKHGAFASVLLLAAVVGAACWYHSTYKATSVLESTPFSTKIEVSGKGGKACSGPAKDCSMTKCCNVTGFKCYLSKTQGAICMDDIKPGDSSSPHATGKLNPKEGDTRPGDQVVLWDSSMPATGTTMFCFTAYTKDTGSTKQSFEKELLQAAYDLKTSVFACDSYMVYSDVPITLGDFQSTVVSMPHLAKRKSTGAWVNGPAFQNIFSSIKESGLWSAYDWTIKTDADAVFFPDRLKLRLSSQEVTEKGIYFTNCEHVSNGFFGSIEVFSKSAVESYLSSLEACIADPKINNVTYGEDLFAQKCMNEAGVSNVEDFYLVTDAVCDAIAVQSNTKATKKVVGKPNCEMGTPVFHPLKKVPDWLACYDTAVQRPR